MQKLLAFLFLLCPFIVRAGTTYFFNQTHLICSATSNPYLESVSDIAFHLNGLEQKTKVHFVEKNYQSIPEIKSDESVFNFILGTKHRQVIKSTTKIFQNAKGEVVSVEEDESQIAGNSIQICDE